MTIFPANFTLFSKSFIDKKMCHVQKTTTTNSRQINFLEYQQAKLRLTKTSLSITALINTDVLWNWILTALRRNEQLSSIPWKCQKKCNGQKMRLDWILVRICLNFHFLASKWHLIASKYPKFAVPWKWRFPARPFYRQKQWAKDEIELDSSQYRFKFSFSSLKMALNCL